MSATPAPQDDPQADLERAVLPTRVGRRTAWLLAAFFVGGTAVVPVVQAAVEWNRTGQVRALDLFTRAPTGANLHRYENDLKDQSVAKTAVRPEVQLRLGRYLRSGNSNVVVGRDGWLFYKPGVEFLTGRGILDPSRLDRRRAELAAAGEHNPAPNPVPAVLAFDAACRAAGAHLVVMPVPDKASLQPAELTVRLAGVTEVPTNPDYSRLLDELRAAGVDVFDPTPNRLSAGDPPRFLRQDTHWMPDWMGAVADGLATHVRGSIPPKSLRGFRADPVPVGRVGDLVDMLGLPAGQTLYPPQQIVVDRVLDPTGAPWKPNPGADVLLLGDSFSNIYSAGEMGWGDAAGFPAQVARRLDRDVDVIALNGSGATGTRRELAHRPAPLAGKRVVIWQFAAREFVVGNWDIIPFPVTAPPGATPPPDANQGTALVIEGTVTATSRVPAPFSVPYKDCLTYVKLRVDRVAEGTYPEDHLIAVLWGMKDNALLPAASYQPGVRLRLRLVPLSQAPTDFQNVRRVDDLDDFDHRPYLGLEEREL